ncbi:hypothetical protein ACN9MZ_19265 [Pseudoduganella sp. S-14]|jgi:hypothetical protein|uniref:hypothetical protein n=1 Tax=Pseudoduganella sp. S-14 TaxID=3404065 RepID=UPI003CF2296B
MSNEFQAICEKCGGKMVARHEGSMQGLFCTRCDWSVVTTNIAGIKLDRTQYDVFAINGDYKNHSHIKVVAEVTGSNSLAARKLLQEPTPAVFRGSAVEVKRIKAILNSVGMFCKIIPDFPW